MLIEKLMLATDFTNQEKALATYILKYPDEFQSLNCEALGLATFTSKSTVVRLCKKLGVSGYQELKKILYYECEEAKNKTDEKSLTLHAMSNAKDILQIVPKLYEKAVSEMNVHNNINQYRRILNRMSNMQQIDFYGTGYGYTLLEIASQKFNAIGLESKTYNSLNERYLFSHPKKNKMMAFVLTLSGNNPLVVRVAKTLKSLSIYVVGITGLCSQEIVPYCDEIIEISYESIQYETEMIMIHHSVAYVLDLFFAGMLVKNYDQITKQEHFKFQNYDMFDENETKVSKK